MRCDICGKRTQDLTALLSIYKTDEIEDICHDCQKEVNDQLSKLQRITFRMNEHWLKKFMRNLKIKLTTTI